MPHIGRFNLTTEAARRILDAADLHLGAMSVRYALAIHEDYLKTCLSMLHRGGLCTRATVSDARLATSFDSITAAAGGSFPPGPLAQLHTIRLMRNCLIHSGGRADRALLNAVAAWPRDAEEGWMKLTKRTLRGLHVGDHVAFGQGELILTLAVTKTLGRVANELLQPALPRPLWADLVVEHLQEGHPTVLRAPDRLRRAVGLARHDYLPLQLARSELQDALERASLTS